MAGQNKLTALAVSKAKPGKHSDGAGLWLYQGDGSGKWVLRVTVGGKRREMGLGGYPAVSLKAARVEAEKWRSVAVSGRDPIREREKERKAAAEVRPTVATVAELAFEARKRDLKGEGKAGRWWSPVELHLLPKLGMLPVEDVTQNNIRDALKGIWHEKAVTASRALNRLAIVLQHGAAMGLDVDMQATKKARALLGKQRTAVKHIPAMAWQDVPAFFAELDAVGGGVERALQLVILTGCRSGEVRAAQWSEIDLTSNVWAVPGERTKTGGEHRVPLSDEALRVLEAVRPIERAGWVFPSARRGCVSDMAMSMNMRRRGLEARPHGFRSSFRDWCEHVGADYLAAETSLSHKVGSQVERAYRRDDLLEKRRVLMQRWADHVAGRGSALVRSITG